ncbi:MAG: hypothetical protein R2748_03060 [Bryobacterales bacterium]
MPWEGHTVQFRAESFNFTNTPFFGQPNTSIGTPAAGQITDADDPRRIQFARSHAPRPSSYDRKDAELLTGRTFWGPPRLFFHIYCKRIHRAHW